MIKKYWLLWCSIITPLFDYTFTAYISCKCHQITVSLDAFPFEYLQCWTEQGYERKEPFILFTWIFCWNSDATSVTCAAVKRSHILGDLGACSQVGNSNGRHSRELGFNMLNEKVSVLAQLPPEGQGKGKALWEDFSSTTWKTRSRWLTLEDPCCAKDWVLWSPLSLVRHFVWRSQKLESSEIAAKQIKK